MSWKQLLAQRKVQLHTTSKQELDGLRALIERDLTDAALAGLSADRRFATAYNAALQTAKMVIACAGYRIASTPGHHRLHFEIAELRSDPVPIAFWITSKRADVNATSSTMITRLLQQKRRLKRS
jgi:hypothetical protein